MTISIALPSKGRLKEASIETFENAGFQLELPENARSYQGQLNGAGLPANGVEIKFLSASEIARELIKGTVHAGITGEDLARETNPKADEHLTFAKKLGFGYADVVLAVPQSWIDVENMADLDDVGS